MRLLRWVKSRVWWLAVDAIADLALVAEGFANDLRPRIEGRRAELVARWQARGWRWDAAAARWVR